MPLLLSEMHRGGLLAAASLWEQRAQPHCLLPAGFISLQARQVSFVQHTAGVPLAAQQRLRCRLAALPAHTPVKRRGATREGRAELLLPSPGAPEARASSLRRGGSWLEEPPAPLNQRNPETAWGWGLLSDTTPSPRGKWTALHMGTRRLRSPPCLPHMRLLSPRLCAAQHPPTAPKTHADQRAHRPCSTHTPQHPHHHQPTLMHTLHTRGAAHKHAPARTHMHIHAQAGAAPTHRLGAVCMPAETRTRSALHLTHGLVVELTPRHKRAHRLRSGSHTHARRHKHSLGFSHTQVQCGSQGHSDRATLRRGCRTPLCSHGALTRCTQHLHASASPLPRAHPAHRHPGVGGTTPPGGC